MNFQARGCARFDVELVGERQEILTPQHCTNISRCIIMYAHTRTTRIQGREEITMTVVLVEGGNADELHV